MDGAGPTLAASRGDERLTGFAFASWMFFPCEDAMKGGGARMTNVRTHRSP